MHSMLMFLKIFLSEELIVTLINNLDYPFQPITPSPKPTSAPRPPGVCTKNEATCQNGECISREYVWYIIDYL
jgi:hypothetical protein